MYLKFSIEKPGSNARFAKVNFVFAYASSVATTSSAGASSVAGASASTTSSAGAAGVFRLSLPTLRIALLLTPVSLT
jgi:hypothetical protein